MKKIEVKLYYYHDIDLVSIYRSADISFPDATKKALKAYAEGKAFKIKVGEKKEKRTHEIYKKCFHYYIALNEEKDKEIIELLNNITFGYRNNFIKTVLRHYLGCELSAEYLTNNDQAFLDRRAEILAAGKETVEVKHAKKESEKTKEDESALIPEVKEAAKENEKTEQKNEREEWQEEQKNEREEWQEEQKNERKVEPEERKNERKEREEEQKTEDETGREEKKDIDVFGGGLGDLLSELTEQY